MGDTKIEWAGKTWNPIKARLKEELNLHRHGGLKVIPQGKVGYHCEHASPGCVNCYAEAMNRRTLPAWGTGSAFNVPNRSRVDIVLDEKVLLEPLGWKKPTRIFPGSMTDLFADFVTDEMLDRIFAVAALCGQHTLLFLTKRAERMHAYMTSRSKSIRFWEEAARSFGYTFKFKDLDGKEYSTCPFPLSNVHLGVSVENQEWADKRIPWLIKTPACLRWLSIEPQIGPVDLFTPEWSIIQGNIGWIVQGGESGRGARPFDIYWARAAREQCAIAKVPLFLKQLGAKPMYRSHGDNNPRHLFNGLRALNSDGAPLRDKKGGDMAEWPEHLRVREFPRSQNNPAPVPTESDPNTSVTLQNKR